MVEVLLLQIADEYVTDVIVDSIPYAFKSMIVSILSDISQQTPLERRRSITFFRQSTNRLTNL